MPERLFISFSLSPCVSTQLLPPLWSLRPRSWATPMPKTSQPPMLPRSLRDLLSRSVRSYFSFVCPLFADFNLFSPPALKLPSWNSSRTTGNRGGLLHTRRRKTPSRRRIGLMSANGPLRNPPSTRVLTETRVWLLRMSRPTTPSLPSSRRRSITRTRLLLSSMRSSRKVSNFSLLALTHGVDTLF